jgi:hypothetical protein
MPVTAYNMFVSPQAWSLVARSTKVNWRCCTPHNCKQYHGFVLYTVARVHAAGGARCYLDSSQTAVVLSLPCAHSFGNCKNSDVVGMALACSECFPLRLAGVSYHEVGLLEVWMNVRGCASKCDS